MYSSVSCGKALPGGQTQATEYFVVPLGTPMLNAPDFNDASVNAPVPTCVATAVGKAPVNV